MQEYPKVRCAVCGYTTTVHKEQLTPEALNEDTRCPKCKSNCFEVISDGNLVSWCYGCKQYKPTDEFIINAEQQFCRECRAVEVKETLKADRALIMNFRAQLEKQV